MTRFKKTECVLVALWGLAVVALTGCDGVPAPPPRDAEDVFMVEKPKAVLVCGIDRSGSFLGHLSRCHKLLLTAIDRFSRTYQGSEEVRIVLFTISGAQSAPFFDGSP